MQILTDYLKKHDFTVQIGTPNLPTAFVARYTKSSGGPSLGVVVGVGAGAAALAGVATAVVKSGKDAADKAPENDDASSVEE